MESKIVTTDLWQTDNFASCRDSCGITIDRFFFGKFGGFRFLFKLRALLIISHYYITAYSKSIRIRLSYFFVKLKRKEFMKFICFENIKNLDDCNLIMKTSAVGPSEIKFLFYKWN